MMKILPLYYFAPISWYRYAISENQVQYDLFEKFVSRTHRNRCEIYAANGKLALSVPVVKESTRQTIKEVEISYAENWMNLHWRSIQSAYGKCAYFDYFAEEVKSLIYSEEKYLHQLNEKILFNSLKWLRVNIKPESTKEFCAFAENDFRKQHDLFLPFQSKPYYQAFESRYGFIPDLSILDYLFQAGPKI